MAAEHIFCTSCGAVNQPDARFCYKCGAPIRILEAAPTAPVPPPLGSTPPLADTPPVVEPPAFARAAEPPAFTKAAEPPQPAQPRAVPPARPASSDFITLSCPSCGGKLAITSDLERFACQFCGHEHIVRRSGGTVSLEPVMKMMNQLSEDINFMGSGINRMTAISEKQAAESAIKRLRKEIEDLSALRLKKDHDKTSVWMTELFFVMIFVMSIILLIFGEGMRVMQTVATFIAIPFGICVVVVFIAAISVTKSNNKAMNDITNDIIRKNQEIRRNEEIINS